MNTYDKYEGLNLILIYTKKYTIDFFVFGDMCLDFIVRKHGKGSDMWQ